MAKSNPHKKLRISVDGIRRNQQKSTWVETVSFDGIEARSASPGRKASLWVASLLALSLFRKDEITFPDSE